MSTMNNSSPSPSRSTVNGHKYTAGADTVRLAECNTTKVQGVTAGGITSLSTARAEELLEGTTPLN
jgi:hypothetical protein